MTNKFLAMAMVIIACACTQLVNAQLKIADNGNVGIALSNSATPLSKLSIGGAGISNANLYVNGTAKISDPDYYNIYSYLYCASANYWRAAVGGFAVGHAGNVMGVKGDVSPYNTNAHPTGNLYGVYGVAGGAYSGRNYGVFGKLRPGNSTGAGVYGTNNDTIQTLSSRYAGYFRGNTAVNGTFYYTNMQATSDARLKTNISDVKLEAVSQLKELHPVQFQWKQVEDVIVEDSVTIKTIHFSNDIDFNKRHYGLIAQDVQKLFPELVEESGDGYLSVNYMELIPILIQAVQDLSSEVEELKKQIDN